MIKISKRDMTIAQRQQELKVNVEFILNRDGDVVMWSIKDPGIAGVQGPMYNFIVDKMGLPPYNLEKYRDQAN